ncbi:MAG: D-aminoacyl-tRNA deacylase [Cyclobacteriaceae bacterium]|nr:D-aminoacyl-tRNA deacylase [Cyclobacteriaceae bacterium]
MKIVIQRVKNASVNTNNKLVGHISKGLLILVGIETEDASEDIEWLVNKIANLRIFNDEQEVMNLNVNQVNGEVLAISQFTLQASTKKGNRPSYIKAARPEVAIPLYESFLNALRKSITNNVETGEFGADMQVALVNDGPVTIIIDSKNRV